jgi:hypothetical protein
LLKRAPPALVITCPSVPGGAQKHILFFFSQHKDDFLSLLTVGIKMKNKRPNPHQSANQPLLTKEKDNNDTMTERFGQLMLAAACP